MSREEILIATGGAVALVLLALIVLAQVQAARLRGEVADLRLELERRTTTPAPEVPAPVDSTYVITGFPESGTEAVTARVPELIEGRLFADIVARETVVRAGGLLHGLRRALEPETRNRIRFEMSREVKRSRRERRAELKAALRDFRARDRAEGDAA